MMVGLVVVASESCNSMVAGSSHQPRSLPFGMAFVFGQWGEGTADAADAAGVADAS